MFLRDSIDGSQLVQTGKRSLCHRLVIPIAVANELEQPGKLPNMLGLNAQLS